MRRLLVLVPLALVAAACGGSARPELGGGAQFFPPDTTAFLATTPDARWRQLAQLLLQRVPRVPKDADEVDMGVLAGGKLVVVSRKGSTWSGGARLKKSLAGFPRFVESAAAAPGDAIARGYLRGNAVAERLLAIPGQVELGVATFASKFRVVAHPTTRVSTAYLQFAWGAGWATNDGLGLRAHVDGLPLAESNRVRTIQSLHSPYVPALFDEIPADVLRVFDLPMAQSTFEVMAKLPPQLTRLFPAAGNVLPISLDAPLGGETAVYTRRGGEITLVTSPRDVAAAENALDELLAAHPPALRAVTLHRASIGGQLVVSTKAGGIEALRSGGPKLSADKAFGDAGFPDQVTLLAYERGKSAAWGAQDGMDATFTVRFDRSGS